MAQTVSVSGCVRSATDQTPVEYATVMLKECNLWAITDAQGRYRIAHVPAGKVTVTVQCMGYARLTHILTVGTEDVVADLVMQEENLKLEGIEVVARRNTDGGTTSYSVDRTALDNQQVLNLTDISTLLPGGKTVNGTLMSDNRMALRSSSSEKGNASFGTAIEVDGQRIDNNGIMGETLGAGIRNIGSSDIESVDIVTGIPSVEYGDLSNGVVKVNTRKGKSPFIIEGKINQHTRQIAVSKGFDMGRHRGVVNANVEHARSFTDIASPHTAYQRNVMTLKYSNTFFPNGTPLTLNASVTGNVGGYNSEADPDETLKSYSKVRDNMLRGNMEMRLLLNTKWITNLSLRATFSMQDKRAEYYNNASSASAQPYIHTREEGYFIAHDYDDDPNANIILGPTGYWYVRSYNGQKPFDWSVQLKGDWIRRIGKVTNRLMVGAEHKANGNNGRGTYYDDMRYAPTWREYRYDQLPTMHNTAVFLEENITFPMGSTSTLQLTAGLRDDITTIKGSDYGTVASLSPRFNARYHIVEDGKGWLRRLTLHAGWGKSVKLPSFQVLYPAPSYSDILAFTPGSNVNNRAYYAYYTYVANPVYNADLKWQYTHQTDIGLEGTIGGTKVSVSFYHHKTFRPYMSVAQYTPFAYKTTSQSAIEGTGIASADRRYSIDPKTGIVTLYDASGTQAPTELAYTERLSYNTTRTFVNGSPVRRSGLEWTVDFAQIKALRTSIRIDGNYYSYQGVDNTLFADNTTGVGTRNNPTYPLLGYYSGTTSTSTSYTASATVANGSEARQVNLNATFTTHIPKVRLILALRVEASLFRYSRSLVEGMHGHRGVVLDNINEYEGTPYNKDTRNKYVAVYPEYYSTWDNPDVKIPFAETFIWAKDNDKTLYNQLSRLVVKTNYPYTLNPDYLSKFYSMNFTVTKEIGDHLSLSFYANNFLNNMGHIRSSQTGMKISLFASGYIPKFYYGLSMKLKL